MSDIITVRDIDTITTEIKTIEMQVAKTAIYGCIEIGRRLVEAKEIVGHGNWGKYLEENVRYSQQWATDLMNLYREYGQQQESLFESFTNSKSFGNLDVSKHILLLSVPAEERAEFAEANDAEGKTVRELKAAIKERDDALRARDENLSEVIRLTEENKRITAGMVEAADKLETKDEEMEQLRAQMSDAGKAQADAAKKVAELEKKLKTANDAEAKARAELEQAKASPEIPESVMEQLRREAEEVAAKKATEGLRKELEAANAAAAEATRKMEAAEKKLSEAHKSQLMEDPNVAVFNDHFRQVQKEFKQLGDALKAVKISLPDVGTKLETAVRALLDRQRESLGA